MSFPQDIGFNGRDLKLKYYTNLAQEKVLAFVP